MVNREWPSLKWDVPVEALKIRVEIDMQTAGHATFVPSVFVNVT